MGHNDSACFLYVHQVPHLCNPHTAEEVHNVVDADADTDTVNVDNHWQHR